MREVTIQLSEDTFNQIKELTDLENLINRHRDRERSDNYKMEEFIIGCIIDKIEQIKHFDAIHPFIENRESSEKPIVKNRFKEIAKEKNIYIKDIAEQLNMQPPNISKIFNNASQPRFELFVKIWLILGCPPLQQCIVIEGE
ncbi:XRE family transcriptional regulator [Oceanobacillus piezotolerans]|uniref:XRE family transcriptional regulator n=1 Tax=Oceanobacillus piezotolerans TaxID=2448030 RepID=A0A498D571_9BACI|nr:helix-turn-helix transcriptional regulator [Oceanobacillus piezotolerans]RLL44868.1 XRE family transcriptional regulator [Oceanobacillus piezotolerans]